MAKIQGLKEGKFILIFTKVSGLILSPWAQKKDVALKLGKIFIRKIKLMVNSPNFKKGVCNKKNMRC